MRFSQDVCGRAEEEQQVARPGKLYAPCSLLSALCSLLSALRKEKRKKTKPHLITGTFRFVVVSLSQHDEVTPTVVPVSHLYIKQSPLGALFIYLDLL